jgi:hypothetical protein
MQSKITCSLIITYLSFAQDFENASVPTGSNRQQPAAPAPQGFVVNRNWGVMACDDGALPGASVS